MIGAAALAAALLVPGMGFAAARITAPEYLERLARARSLAEAAVADPSPVRMEEVRAALGLPLEMEFGGVTVAIPADPVLAALVGAFGREFTVAATHLSALESAARAAIDQTGTDPARIKDALRRAYVGINGDPSLLERVRRSLGAVLAEIVRSLGRFHGAGSAVAWAIVVAAVIGLLLLIRRLAVVPERARRKDAATPVNVVDWEREEAEALARGDIAVAIRARYRLLVAALSARGVVIDAPSLTAGECRGAVRTSMPAVYPTVERATQLFELAAYAHAPLGRDDVEVVREAERSVRAA